MKLFFKLLIVSIIGFFIWNAVRDRQHFDIDKDIEKLYNDILSKLYN